MSTKAEVPNLRRRLAFLLANRCRFPGRLRTILPEPVILKRLATALRVLIDFGLLCICYHPFPPEKGGKSIQMISLNQAIFLHIINFLLWSLLCRAAKNTSCFILSMNKKEILLVTALGLGLFSGKAADEVIFEDANFSKEGWSNYRDIGDGWEVRFRDFGELVQGVVQEVTVKGSGGIFLSSKTDSFVSVFRSDGTIYAIRSRDGDQSSIGQVEVDGKVDLRVGFDGAFFIYEYRNTDKWLRLGKSDIVGLVSYKCGISTNSRADGMGNYRVIKLESLQGVRFGYTNTPKIPGTPWVVHDPFRPQPHQIDPGTISPRNNPGTPPSDAIVLFDGSNLDAWENNKGGAPKWVLGDGYFECMKKSGTIRSKQKFGSVQLHIEWAAPSEVKGSSQGRGNSGVFLAGLYEVQVQDNYDNLTYPDGQASSLYGFRPPRVNVTRPPGEWQAYDIIFEMPEFKDGKLLKKAKITVLHNGVVTQHGVEIPGILGHKKTQPYREHGPGHIQLQDHGNPVRYRNIWVRELKTIQ